ncbi:MAG TPA: efflux RND transporter periplasmic adaptor subunit [Bacteroidales bacterium]|nr:efflux RND transporter periplasmic adaptor subunit [Bacteroidales bacterium]
MKNLLFIICVIISACVVQCSFNKDEQQPDETSDHDHEGEEHNEVVINSKPDTSVYTLLTLRKQPFSFTFRAGGRISVDSKDVVIITAKSSGLVKLNNDYLFPGVKVQKGDVLFTISGEQLAEGNTELYFLQVKADLDRAKANFERAGKMITDKIITQEEYLTAKNDYEKLQNLYDNLNATSGKEGNLVIARTHGYIKDIYVSEGQKVNPGDQLASIVMEHNLVLKADVSPGYAGILSSVNDASFKVGYSDNVYRLSEMNGRKISQGKATGGNSFFIPVYFRMDYTPELIDGTFAEVYLIGDEINDALVVPNSALMEEFGKIYVFVADDDGDFLKRYIETGNTDNRNTLVKSGLSEGERVVATGTYTVKLSQMTTSAPAHNHNH